MRKIVFASNNANKLRELRQLTAGKIELLSLADISCNDDIPETADTFKGNALQKARWIKDRYGYDCFADDSGLEVDALGGAPGVYSARYAGPGHNSEANTALLLKNLEGISERIARFRTVIALIEGAQTHIFEGAIEGSIGYEKAGEHGFGYDPVFYPEGSSITFAQMTDNQKNAISHRGQAVRKLVDYLTNHIE